VVVNAVGLHISALRLHQFTSYQSCPQVILVGDGGVSYPP
jgi:hypothetical protein